MEKINKYIDHTLLKPEATPDDIKKLCEEAKEYGFYAVCVNSCYTDLASKCLRGSDVKVTTVVGFPLGAMSTDAKSFETSKAIIDGASEIDVVMNVGMLKAKEYEYVIADLKEVARAAHEQRAIVKVIIETSLLTDEEKVKACLFAMEADADFIKTSTGFSTGGATVRDVQIMKAVVGDELKVKASGGIRDYETAKAMIEAGADRIGTSKSIEIVSAL